MPPKKVPHTWQFRDSEAAGWTDFDPLHIKFLEKAHAAAGDGDSEEPLRLPLPKGRAPKGVQRVRFTVSLSNMTLVKGDDDSDEDPTPSEVRRISTAEAAAEKSKEKKRKRDAESSEDEDEDEASDAAQPPAKQARAGEEGGLPKKKGSWSLHESVLVYTRGDAVEAGSGVIGLDMDDTVITTKSGNTFAKDRRDWKFLCPEVKGKLASRHEAGERIVFFSNQAGIAGGGKKFDTAKANEIKAKIIDIEASLGFPIDAFLATAKDAFRKPNTGMWELMEETIGFTAEDRSGCLYVGDAAGRTVPTLGGKKKDFSCSDRKFAHNVGVRFLTPEAYFKGIKPAPFSWGKGFNPGEAEAFAESPTEDGRGTFHSESQEVVLFVGPPASGKTSFAEKHLLSKGYVHVNRDTLNTQSKCQKALREAVAAGKSAVVDNTNPCPSTRKEYIKIAAKADIPIRCFYFRTPVELAKHMNQYREIVTNGERAHVPGIAYNMYTSKFSEPDEDEGFTEVVEIQFVPQFQSEKEKKLFGMFLTE
eukprot:TRINITY_DN574_c2_g1_i1.p1 TRINITY_DN574_c2_g1~~TRINITY_DN574_c2_g1_i1.p1  ORF type:complete len:594 (+),score=184.10 TRINITY_DN574_c2_g1_i1:188-1783(+)